MKRHLEFLAIAVLASVPVLTKLDFDSRSPLPQHEPPCANFACGTLGLSSLDGLDGNGNHCAPDPNQPLSRVTVFSNIEEKRNIPDGTVDLACDFDSSQYSHFPHSMQQLYGCFSNWRDFPELQPVLLLSSNLEAKLKRNHFLNGFLQLMESQLKLQIRNESYHEEQSKHVKSYLIEAVNRSGYMLRHSSDLNHFAEQEFQLSSADVGHACKNEKPRFGILNRSVKSQRSIVNAEMIASIDAVKRLSWNNTVAVKYFEGETFAEQMDFFRSVDILLTPHGAQLTGLPFMNAPCSHVVELFPKSYALPFYFGSLAVASGKRYSYIYMSNISFVAEQSSTKSERKLARSANICPSPVMFVETLHHLLDDWRQCCQSLEIR